MHFKTLNGREKNISVNDYLVNWRGGTRSKFQSAVKAFLYPYWKNKVVCEELRVVGTRMTIDIINLTDKIAVECNGQQHVKYNPYMHGGDRGKFVSQVKRDLDKQRWCEINGYIMVEIYENDLDDLSPRWFKDKYSIDI